MKIAVDDEEISARVTCIVNNTRMRFVLEYPKTEEYTRRVRAALSELLQPANPVQQVAESEEKR